MDRFAVALVCACLLALAADASAQGLPGPGPTVYEVQLAGGSELFVRIVSVGDDEVVLRTVDGVELRVDRARLVGLQPARGRVVDGVFWREDRNASRLFFTATGRSLGAGEAYAGTYMIALPFVAVGVTDAFTVAAGAPVLFGAFEPFYVAPKLRVVRSGSADVSLGTLAFFFQDETVGIAYGVGTFGSTDRALTVGLGFGYSGADFSSQPVAMIGGEARTGRRVKFVTENYFLPGEDGTVLSGGLRFVGARISTDVGVAGVLDSSGGGCCLPIVNFSYAFGRGR